MITVGWGRSTQWNLKKDKYKKKVTVNPRKLPDGRFMSILLCLYGNLIIKQQLLKQQQNNINNAESYFYLTGGSRVWVHWGKTW